MEIIVMCDDCECQDCECDFENKCRVFMKRTTVEKCECEDCDCGDQDETQCEEGS